MKKLIITFTLLITCLVGNPIDPSQFYINELLITDSTWVIEMPLEFLTNASNGYSNNNDTIIIQSRSDTLLYPVNKIQLFQNFCCIRSDSTKGTFQLDKTGDIISINMIDTSEYSNHCSFSFSGFYKKSSLSRTNIWHPYYLYKYYYDLSPTIGSENDTTGGMGILELIISDNHSNPINGNYMFNYEYEKRVINGNIRINQLASSYLLICGTDGCDDVSNTIQFYPDSIVNLTLKFPKDNSGIEKNEQIASQYSLSQNYPNPFNPTTTFKYSIPKRSFVELAVFNMQGNIIKKLVSETLDAGEYHKIWNASEFASGLYIYQLRTKDMTLWKKCLLVK